MTASVTWLIRSRPTCTPYISAICASISRVDSPREYRARILSSNSEDEDGVQIESLTYRQTDPLGVYEGTCRFSVWTPLIAHVGRSGRAA